MVFDHIENLKREFTDQFVVVDDKVAELRRFEGHTGYVKTVNMSGRALVEFMHLENNIGWYDIDVDFLKVVDEPIPPKETDAKAAKPAAAKAVESKPKPGGAMSVADILAAARGGGGAPAAKSEGKAAATPAAEKSAAKPAAKKMSVEEMLAAARSEKSETTTPTAPVTEPELEPPAAETPAPAGGDLPSNPADIVAWCRQRDAS